MFVPDMAQLDRKSPEQIVEFWFNYWNDLYPIPDLKLAIETEGYIASWRAYAAYHRKTTVFNPKNLRWYFCLGTARHEHVHQLLSHHGYNPSHQLHFALVDTALNYAFTKAKGTSKPEINVRHYDLHEDEAATRSINVRLFLLLARRLSRHAGDIETLIATAWKYAEAIRSTVPPKREVKCFSRTNNRLENQIEDMFAAWSSSEANLKAQLKKLEADAADLLSTNSKLKFGFGCLLTATTFLITKL